MNATHRYVSVTVMFCTLVICASWAITNILGPHETVRTITEQDSAARSAAVEQQWYEEPRTTMEYMTQDEFDSIHKGDTVKVLEKYPEPSDNVANDNRSWYHAARGGRYWLYWTEGDNQKVKSKEYKHDG